MAAVDLREPASWVRLAWLAEAVARDDDLRLLAMAHRHHLVGAAVCEIADARDHWRRAAEVLADATKVAYPWAEGALERNAAAEYRRMLAAWEAHFGGPMDAPEMQEKIDATVAWLNEHNAGVR